MATNNTSANDPKAIKARIEACRNELAELKKALRYAEAMARAEEARQQREQLGVAYAR